MITIKPGYFTVWSIGLLHMDVFDGPSFDAFPSDACVPRFRDFKEEQVIFGRALLCYASCRSTVSVQ